MSTWGTAAPGCQASSTRGSERSSPIYPHKYRVFDPGQPRAAVPTCCTTSFRIQVYFVVCREVGESTFVTWRWREFAVLGGCSGLGDCGSGVEGLEVVPLASWGWGVYVQSGLSS